MEDHEVTDVDGNAIASHMHTVHHLHWRAIRDAKLEELDLMHADDHDDLRRGIGSTGPPSAGKPAPTAAQVTEMVDEAAKAEMRRQGRDPEAWDRLPTEVRDQLRLLALDRLRTLP